LIQLGKVLVVATINPPNWNSALHAKGYG